MTAMPAIAPAERLAEIRLELDRIEDRRQQLFAARAAVVRQIIAAEGWKRASEELGGVSRTRVYGIARASSST